MVEDEVFLNQWKQKLTAITQKKHKIKIIHWVDRNVANLASILKQWLPLHLTGQIESWFYPKYSDTSIKFTLFIIENHIAITGMSGSSAKKIYTSFHTNPLSLEQHQWAFETILEKCHQLVTL